MQNLIIIIFFFLPFKMEEMDKHFTSRKSANFKILTPIRTDCNLSETASGIDWISFINELPFSC